MYPYNLAVPIICLMLDFKSVAILGDYIMWLLRRLKLSCMLASVWLFDMLKILVKKTLIQNYWSK